MKILFIYPEFPDTFWSFKHALKFIRKKASSPPLGLLTVASMLPTGWEKRLVDLNAESLKHQDLQWADMVFLSAMAVQRESAQHVIARCKEVGVKVVAGGPLFTQEHEQFPDVDHFVLNEAELTLPLFLADLALGRAQRIYMTNEYPDIRLTPAPRWELANLKLYTTMSIQFSRGCPYKLRFLQRDRVAWPPSAHQDGISDYGRVGWSVCAWLATERVFCGRQFHREQEAAQGRNTSGADRVAQRQNRHAVQHRGIHQPG
jgi:hypothetical protein